MDLPGQYSHGRHDPDPVTSSYSFARHGIGGLIALGKQLCVHIIARFVRSTSIFSRRSQTTALSGRFVRSSGMTARRLASTALTARRPLTTALNARMGEC